MSYELVMRIGEDIVQLGTFQSVSEASTWFVNNCQELERENRKKTGYRIEINPIS